MAWLIAIGTLLAAAPQHLPNGLEGFHAWRKVNKEPHYVHSEFDFLCVGPTPEQRRKAKENPHVWKFITVYVNATGERSMFSGRTFPVGSVIVKEKFAREGRKTPKAELSTVMIKRKKGFNPKCGDWEFAVLDAAGKKLMDRGKLEACMKCHVRQAKRDFVFGSYRS